MNELYIKGLIYYTRVDDYGNVIKEVGKTSSDLTAASSLILLECDRLGSMLGLEELSHIAATDEGNQVYLRRNEGDAEVLVTSRKASVNELLTEIHKTNERRIA